VSPVLGLSGRFEPAMLQAAPERQEMDQAQMESDYLGLWPVQNALEW